MKYLRQFGIILLLSLAGELIHHCVPLKIPASIYGLLFLFLGLWTKWIPLTAVEEAGAFLIQIMPVMFIPAAAGLLSSYGELLPIWRPFLVITGVSTVLVLAAVGKVTQFFMKKGEAKGGQNRHE